MNRLTHERSNGIKSGYWSPEKKQELVQALAAYENTGLSPDQIREMDKLYREKCREAAELQKKHRWIPVEEELPERENGQDFSAECSRNPILDGCLGSGAGQKNMCRDVIQRFEDHN